MSGFDKVLQRIGHLLVRLLRRLLAGLGGAEELIQEEPEMAEQMPFLPGEFKEASPFWQALFQILEKVFVCIGNKNKPPAMQVCPQIALASSKNLLGI